MGAERHTAIRGEVGMSAAVQTGATAEETIFKRADRLLVQMGDAVSSRNWADAIDLSTKFRLLIEIEQQFRDARKGKA
jgi:hypothetical protein